MPRSVTRRTYEPLRAEIQALLEQERNEAFQRIDQIRVRTDLESGKRLLAAELRYGDRADYGRRVIAALAEDIGFSDSNLYIDLCMSLSYLWQYNDYDEHHSKSASCFASPDRPDRAA